MFFSDLSRVLLRRWYLVLLGLLATLGLCLATTSLVPPVQQMQAHILLLPPRSAVPAGGNPYLALGGLSPTAAVVATSLTDESTMAGIVATGATAPYEVAPDTSTSAPVLLISVDGSTPQEASLTLRRVVDQIPIKLVALQKATEIRESSFITSTVLSIDVKPTPLRKTQLRALIAVLGGGVVGTALFAAVIDALIERKSLDSTPRANSHRSRRKRSQSEQGQVQKDDEMPVAHGTLGLESSGRVG